MTRLPDEEVQKERELFKKQHAHLDLSEKADAWDRPIFKHDMIEIKFEGWLAHKESINPPGLTTEDLLVLLIEECSEVQKAATKCLRFGFDAHHPAVDYGKNDEILASEVGDLLAVVDALKLDDQMIQRHRAIKIARALEMKRLYGVKR